MHGSLTIEREITKIVLAAFVMGASVGAANAQGEMRWYANPGPFAQLTETLPVCPGANPPIYSNECAVVVGPATVTGDLSVTNSNMPSAKCDNSWTLVLDASGRPMCAKELKEPTH